MTQIPDSDRPETQEWLEALDDVIATQGEERAQFLMQRLQDHGIMQVMQPLGHRRLRVGRDLAVRDMRQARTLGTDDPPAGARQRGIEAEDDQPSFSITSSDTS